MQSRHLPAGAVSPAGRLLSRGWQFCGEFSEHPGTTRGLGGGEWTEDTDSGRAVQADV